MTPKIFGVCRSRIIEQLSVYNEIHIGNVNLVKLNTNSFWCINFNALIVKEINDEFKLFL